MVNNEISDEGLGVQGSLSAEFTQGSSLPNEPLPAGSNSYSPTPVSNTEVDENTRLSPTSLYCSVPLNKDVQNIIESFSKTEMENVAKKNRKIPCLYCDRTFVAESLRQKHVERIHSVKQARRSSSRLQQPFSGNLSCFFCEKFTSDENRLDDLFVHLVTVHQEKYFGCLVCKERFILPSQLQEHNENLHGTKCKIDVQWSEQASDNSSAINEHDMLKTKHKAKTKKEISSEIVAKGNLRRSKHASQKVLRSKRIALKSTKLGIKRSTRLQSKLTTVKNDKRRPKQKEQIKLEKDQESRPDSDNPYPTFDAFYRVKKITDHSIDNIRISSLTFNDVFDQAFFTRINCNIRENLLNHLDGKLFKNEESESRISNFEKTQTDYTNTENFGCEISLNAATPIATNVLTAQFGDDPETQIEYGSKASKKKTPPKKDEVHYKYFTRRKYQASILESKENRDLSKLDMWTQFVIKTRQQKIEASQKTDKEKIEYKKRGEYRAKLANDELNRILDRRGPFEDLKEEANKKAALECNFNQEAHEDVACILDDILDNVFTLTEVKEVKTELTDSEIPAYLNLIKAPLNNETYIDKSDRITLICSSQETENFEAPQVVPKDKNATVELTGEWARSRLYICAACGLKLANMKLLMDHKNIVHQNVWCQHYEFVGNQGEFYKHLSIPGLGKMNYIEENLGYKTWKRSEARLCSKCNKQCNSLGELHRHVLECGEDWTWMLVRKKCKYRPFGSKARKKRRGLFKRIIQKDKLPDENRVKRKYKKRFEGPRPKPSDAETIERMLANLPAKRATRKMVCLKDGLTRRKSNNTQSTNNAPVQQTSTMMKKMRIRRNRAELLLQESNTILKGKMVKTVSSKCNPALHLRKSVRNLNKVISSKLIDTNNTLMVKRKLMNAFQQQQRITRRTQMPPQENDVTESIEEIPEVRPPIIEEVETKKKVNILKRVKNAFKNTTEKIEINLENKELTTEISDIKLEEVIQENNIETTTNTPVKKKKKTFASKLIRTLSMRKKKADVLEALPQESPEEVQKISISEDSENTKNNGKRKSRLGSVRRVVKKMKVTRNTKKDNKAIHKDEFVDVGGHFLEEGSNTLSAGTVASEISPTENVDQNNAIIKPNEVKEEMENVVKSVEPPASENVVESISEGHSEDIKHLTDQTEKQNLQKPKMCKRSKGLNACIAMLTSKLLQKDDTPKCDDTKQSSIVNLEIKMNIENHPIDLSKNISAPLIVPNNKIILQSSIMEQENILEHKSIEPISSQANLPSSEDIHVEKVENIIKSFEDTKCDSSNSNGLNKLINGFIPLTQNDELNTALISESNNLEEVDIKGNTKVLGRKIGQRRENPKKKGRKSKVVINLEEIPNTDNSSKVQNSETLEKSTNSLEFALDLNINNTINEINEITSNLLKEDDLLTPRATMLEKIVENCKTQLYKRKLNKKLLREKKTTDTSAKNKETHLIKLEIPTLDISGVSNTLNKPEVLSITHEPTTNNIVKTPAKRGRRRKQATELDKLLPTFNGLESGENISTIKTQNRRTTRNSIQNSPIDNSIAKVCEDASLDVVMSVDDLENKNILEGELIVDNNKDEISNSNFVTNINEIFKSCATSVENENLKILTETNTASIELASEPLENIKNLEPVIEFKNFGKDPPVINHSITNILESSPSVQSIEFNFCNSKNDLIDMNAVKMDIVNQPSTTTPKGRRRRRRNERRTIANKNKNVECIINDFTDNKSCTDFTNSMLDGDLNLVDDSSKENFGGVIKSDLNIVTNHQSNEVNSKSPNNKEMLEMNVKLDTKHVCEEVTNDLPTVNSESVVENSKIIISKFRINNDKPKEIANNSCSDENIINSPPGSDLIKIPKTDHFIGNILRPPKLKLFDHFKTKPLMQQMNEDGKTVCDKLDSTPPNNDNLLFARSTQVCNIFKPNDTFSSLAPFNNDFQIKKTNFLTKSNHEDIYNFEDETDLNLEIVSNKSPKCTSIVTNFVKNNDSNLTDQISTETTAITSVESCEVKKIVDVTDSEDELPLSKIKSKIVEEEIVELSPNLTSNVDVENNIPLGDVAPIFDNSIISTNRGESIASNTDEINQSQSEDTTYYTKGHEDLIIRLKTKNKSKKGHKKCNEYFLDNPKYELKTNHEMLDTIFNEIVDEMKVGHKHKKKSKKKKNSNKERKSEKLANTFDQSEYFNSNDHTDLSKNEPMEDNSINTTEENINEISFDEQKTDSLSMVNNDKEVNDSSVIEINDNILNIESTPVKRRRGRPRVAKLSISEEIKQVEDVQEISSKQQSSIYDFDECAENADSLKVSTETLTQESPRRKCRGRNTNYVEVPDNLLDTFSSMAENQPLDFVNETNPISTEGYDTPKVIKQTDADESYLQTPDLNDSTVTQKIQTKLKLKQGKKKKVDKRTEIGDGTDNYCDICDKRFIRIDSLAKHKRTLTHIAKLSEIEAREAAEKAKMIEEEKVVTGESETVLEFNPVEEKVAQNDDMLYENNENKPIEDASIESKDVPSLPIKIPDITTNVILTSPFSFTTNTDSLKLADIISDVIPTGMDTTTEPFSTLNNHPCETKRYKSLGERKSFDSDTVGYNSQSSFSNHKMSTTTDAFLDKQISILENIIEENKASYQYMDETSVASNKSDDRCPSDMSLVSDIKPDDSHIISFSHSTNIVNSIIHSEPNFVKPTQYEEISEDSTNTRNFDEHRARKVLNRDEELFLECCSLLKSSSEVSNYSKKSASRTISMVNSYSLKPEEEPDWLERKSFSPKMKPYSSENNYISEDSCPATPIGENYEDYSNSNTSKTQWISNVQENKEFHDISPESSDDDNGNDADYSYYDVDDKIEDNNSMDRLNTETNSKTSIISNEESSESFDFRKNLDVKFEGIVAEAMKSKVTTPKKKNSKKTKPGEPTQTSIIDYVVPLPKRSDSSSSSFSSESKKMLTKGAMKIFEGLKVSIPTEELDMKEVLNCSPTSKRLELESEPLATTPVQKSKVNLKKVGNKLGLKVTKKRVKCKKTPPPIKIKKSLIPDPNKPLDIYDFEETQDNTDLFIPNKLSTFRTQVAEKTKPIKDFENLEGIDESDSESNNHYIDSFSVGTQSSFSTETESINSSKKNSSINNVTKKKCVIMGRIFKNAIKPKDDIKDLPNIDSTKLEDNYVLGCENATDDKKTAGKMSEKEMNMLFDKLLEESKNERGTKPDAVINQQQSKEEVEPPLKPTKNRNLKHKKRVRKASQSSDDEFNLSKAPKKRTVKKKGKVKEDGINLEQELKECMGVAGRKSQRKCTSGKQNVLIEYWSSDDSDFEALLRQTLQPSNKPMEPTKIKTKKVIDEPVLVNNTPTDEPVVEAELKKVEIVEEEIIPPINPEILNEIIRDVKESKKKVRRKSSTKVRDDNGVKLKIPTEETLASNRRKRAAADTLYYWSSSSDDDSQNLIEVKPVRDEVDEDDRPMQHGWIVGDSPKKLVTMLAQAKGKKLDTKCVKEQGKKRTTL